MSDPALFKGGKLATKGVILLDIEALLLELEITTCERLE